MAASGEGLVRKVPSGRRMASTSAPVRSRRWAERSELPASDESSETVSSSRRNCERAVVHDDVDEVDHVGLDHEGGHAVTAQLLGVHHPVRPGPDQLGLGGLVAGPGDDLEVGPHRLAGHRDVEVVRVGVEGGHQGAPPGRCRPEEDLVVGHVARDGRVGHLGQPVGVAVDDHHVAPGVGEERATSRPTRPQPQTMTWWSHPVDVVGHPSSPYEVSHVAFDQQLEARRVNV